MAEASPVAPEEIQACKKGINMEMTTLSNTPQVHLHEDTDWFLSQTHTQAFRHNSYIIKSSHWFTLYVTLKTMLLCLSIVMLIGLIKQNKHAHACVAHTQAQWMSNCPDKCHAALTQWGRMSCFVGHCGAVSGLLSCSAYSDKNNSFIKEHDGKNKQPVILWSLRNDPFQPYPLKFNTVHSC